MGEIQEEKKMERRLEEAAILGDTDSLRKILGEDSLILRRVKTGCFVYTPLQVAASEGHLEFVRQLLANKALARVLDNRLWSALHLAAANGHNKIVEVLVEANASMCLALDGGGRNPLHLAAMEGHDSVLRVFFAKNPHWIHELLKAIDGDGNTILHLAVKNKKFEAVKLLLNKIKDQVKAKNIQETENPLNMINKCGCTALDIMEKFKHEVKDLKKVKKMLRKTGALKAATLNADQGVKLLLDKIKDQVKAKNMQEAKNTLNTIDKCGCTIQDILEQCKYEVQEFKTVKKRLRKVGTLKAATLNVDRVLSKRRDALMVVASLMATMAFQAGVAPPGGVWQETTHDHNAGESVIAHRYSSANEIFFIGNTIGFIASLSTILFLMTGLPFKKKFFTQIMVLIMCLAITSVAFTYAYSFMAICPERDYAISILVTYGGLVWCGVICVLVLIHTIPLLNRWLKVSWDIIWPPMKNFMEFIWDITQPQREKLTKFILARLKDSQDIIRLWMKKLMKFISPSSNQRLPMGVSPNP